MSASQDKKKRQEQRAAGTDKWSVAQREAEKEKQKSRRQWTVGTIIVVVLVVAILAASFGPSLPIPSVTAGDMSYTNAEYQYFFYNSYYNFVNTYSSYLSIFFDNTKPLDSQEFDGTYLTMFGLTVPEALANLPEGKTATWHDYFSETAQESMADLSFAYKAATEAGYALTEEDSAAIDEEIANFSTYAEQNGFPNAKAYILAAYGRGCNENTIRKLMGMSAVVSSFLEDKQESFTYTAAQLSEWYEENKDSYDTFDYSYYYVAAETVETTEDVKNEETGEVTQETKNVTTDETMAAAKKTAEDIAAAIEGKGETAAVSFEEAVKAVDEAAEVTENSGAAGQNLSSIYSEWMLDGSRKEGDVTVAESEGSGYYVVQYGSRDANTYKTASVRHILVKAVDSDADSTYSDAEKATAKAAVEAIYDEWKAGDKTEDSFAALANEKSEDAGSNTNGGLYENIAKGQMVTEFNDFCFADGRKPGDVEIVYGESSSYSGYHLVYFVGNGARYCDYLAENALRSTDYNAWYETIVEGATYSSNFMLKFAADQ